MKFLAKAAIAACLPLALAACATYTAPVIPGYAWLFTQSAAPLSLDFNPTTVADLKAGEGEVMTLLGIVSVGDASIVTAAKNGGIREVHHADYKIMNILGVYQVFTTVAYGK